jgi:hypothetical protein
VSKRVDASLDQPRNVPQNAGAVLGIASRPAWQGAARSEHSLLHILWRSAAIITERICKVGRILVLSQLSGLAPIAIDQHAGADGS